MKLFFVLLFISIHISAMTLRHTPSIDDQIYNSTDIINGKIINKVFFMEAGKVKTSYEILINDVYKGDTKQNDIITIIMTGGKKNGHLTIVGGGVEFSTDNNLIVFMNKKGNEYRLSYHTFSTLLLNDSSSKSNFINIFDSKKIEDCYIDPKNGIRYSYNQLIDKIKQQENK